MKQWAGLGKFLAGHMQIIVPICVALGVLFPQQIGVLKPIVPALFAFMTFQGALSNTFHQVAEVFHRPLHLILALLVSAVLIPIAAYAIGSLFFGSNPNLVCGIVLEYSVPVAVTAFMWISMFGGSAWTRDPLKENSWYLTTFTPHQCDLNWENPAVRQEIVNIMPE